MRVLVIVAHPDDESFWCGGQLAALAKAGHAVRVVALSDGVASRPGTNEAARFVAFAQAMRALGVAESMVYSVFPDQQADTVPQLRINQAVESEVAQYRPTVVYTHHAGDLNLDHRRVAEAVLVASRPGSSDVQEVYHIRPEWPDRCVGPAWTPTATLDITATLEQKVRACLCYEAELRPYPHPRSERAIRESPYEWFMRTGS